MRRASANYLSQREALDRTLLLMREDLVSTVKPTELISALRSTSVAIISDDRNISSHSAQCCTVTLALLLARSGHTVYLDIPDCHLIEGQPPLQPGSLIEQLVFVGRDLIPGISFKIGLPRKTLDLAIVLGNTRWTGNARQAVRLNASAWRARMMPPGTAAAWPNEDWPIGAMGAAALGAGEAFKIAMRRLVTRTRDVQRFSETYAPTAGRFIDLAPIGTPKISTLNNFDFISGGAITNAALYSLLRLPKVTGTCRIIESDEVALSNLNRGMLFLRSQVGPKALILAQQSRRDFAITPLVARYEQATLSRIGRLADAVLMGVDDIPARWAVQRAWPKWLGIGATTHYSAMASFHTPNLPCAGCLHPIDEPLDGPIPTLAFISFWAGLWLATLFLRHQSNGKASRLDQQIYFSPLGSENPWTSPVSRRPDCPVSCASPKWATG